MKRILRFSRTIIVIVVILLFIFIMFSYINNKIHLYKEGKLFVPMGQMVEVNGHKMHVYTEGKGDITFVFMSGGGTSSPVLDFKSLYTLLSDSYRTVVVEKAGYGFSDIVDVDRDIDTILYETREALSKAGISGPYVLFPHSMSGIEALYWAQTYPDEVVAIIGLDIAVPEAYEDYNINIPIVKLASIASKIGITRWIPHMAESDAMQYGTLTDEEKEIYKVVFYRRTATKTMINEVQNIKSNARKVNEFEVANIPVLIFSSNGQGTGWDEVLWKTFQKEFIENINHGEIINLDCSHYVHDIEYKKIAKLTKEFLEKGSIK